MFLGRRGSRGWLTLGVVALLNRVPEVLAVEVGVRTRRDLGLLPDHVSPALEGLPVPLDKLGLSVVVDEAESVNTESILAVHVSAAPCEPTPL